MDWIDNLIYRNEFEVKANGVSFGDEYQFGVVDSPQELERRIRALNCPADNPKQVARLVAGWCWRWSTDLAEDGDLRHDVRIGDWSVPWETNNRQARKPFRDRYAPTANLWASHPMGVNQVGCIFSAQGFEVDYVGVIMCLTLRTIHSVAQLLLCLAIRMEFRNRKISNRISAISIGCCFREAERDASCIAATRHLPSTSSE